MEDQLRGERNMACDRGSEDSHRHSSSLSSELKMLLQNRWLFHIASSLYTKGTLGGESGISSLFGKTNGRKGIA